MSVGSTVWRLAWSRNANIENHVIFSGSKLLAAQVFAVFAQFQEPARIEWVIPFSSSFFFQVNAHHLNTNDCGYDAHGIKIAVMNVWWGEWVMSGVYGAVERVWNVTTNRRLITPYDMLSKIARQMLSFKIYIHTVNVLSSSPWRTLFAALSYVIRPNKSDYRWA